jgi:hypothetical protein
MFLIRIFLACATATAPLVLPARADTAPRRVLLLYSYEREFSHYTFAGMFRPDLTRASAGRSTSSR